MSTLVVYPYLTFHVSHSWHSMSSSECNASSVRCSMNHVGTNISRIQFPFRLDKVNRCVLWADAHMPAITRSEFQFLHNTKISRSAINEEKAFNKSRQRNHPVGRFIGLPEMMHQLLGYPDIHTNLDFVEISTYPFEYRSTTRVKLTKYGSLQRPAERRHQNNRHSDNALVYTESCGVRDAMLPPPRRFTPSQRLLLQPVQRFVTNLDKISLFGLRPVELIQLVRRVGDYYAWFETSDKAMKKEDIEASLHIDVTKCMWIDGLGRRVMMRHNARKPVQRSLEAIERDNVTEDSWKLRRYLLDVIQRHEDAPLFIKPDDGKKFLPIPVFSRISPNRSSNFLLHIMLVLGEYDTELDLKVAESMKHSLAKARLIPNEALDDTDALKRYVNILLAKVVEKILPLQPITMGRIEEFVVKTKQLLESVLLHDTLPLTDLPACILTELLNRTDKALRQEWKDRTLAQFQSMMSNFKGIQGLPSEEEVVNALKLKRHNWDPLNVFLRSSEQSEESYREQQFALRVGINAVKSYSKQFENVNYTKGVLNNGAPGAGKTFVLQAVGLYAMTQGLRVMSSSLMAVRANALGGYHLHRLFQLEIGRKGNLFRLAEVSWIILVATDCTNKSVGQLLMYVVISIACSGETSSQGQHQVSAFNSHHGRLAPGRVWAVEFAASCFVGHYPTTR